jgi:hypothetical protein
MGKALSIKDEATYELVAELAAKTGKSMTQAVNEAVTERLETLKARRLEEAEAWLLRLQANPLPDDAWTEPWDPPLSEVEPIWPE